MKMLIITRRESDLSKILLSACNGCILSPDATDIPDAGSYDCMAILGGTEGKPLILNAYLREKAEVFADSGKPVFLEYVNSFRCVYSAAPITACPHRLVCCDGFTDGISAGDLLDSRCNSYIHPHFLMPGTVPLMYYRKYTPAHDRLKDISGDDPMAETAFFKSGNMLTAAFRMCDYITAGFSPKSRWDSVAEYICTFLGAKTKAVFPESKNHLYGVQDGDFYKELNGCVKRALGLLKNYLVKEDGTMGIREGLSHNIMPDGKRITADNVRADCTGEAAGAFMFSLDKALIKTAENMYSLCYGPLTVHGGEYDGMMRWTEEAWNVCYQDDVARAIIPSLLCAYFGVTDKYINAAHGALEFLCDTTCKDGLRPARTDVLEYIRSDESIKTLAERDNGYASAHYNAYYSAALLLGYAVTGDKKLKDTGIKGLETLMSLYPDTVREHSETSELCRLIFPLSVLYAVTRDKKHYDMLNTVFNDLQAHRHPSGGYAEWDTGYKAACFNNAGGECSLLAENGDPVADLLYTLNWLPLGFAFAYHATKEERFLYAWKDICAFFIKTQIISDDPLLNGAWCRGIDLDRLEYCGIPHDVGWGPCSVETGWTVAEITIGMLIGKDIAEGKTKKR